MENPQKNISPSKEIFSFSQTFLQECSDAIKQINANDIENMATVLAETRDKKGRLFIIGSGGGAGNASHAICDFRKLCNFEAYSPYDNVSELTARVNDDGWDTTIINWLKGSNINASDCILVFSVGGGNSEKNISANIVKAIEHAKKIGAKVVGIVGKDGGTTKQIGDAVSVVPTINPKHITPITEGFQAIIWHLLVSHPKLKINQTKWESTK